MAWDSVRPATRAAEAERLARQARQLELAGDHVASAHVWRRAQEVAREVGKRKGVDHDRR